MSLVKLHTRQSLNCNIVLFLLHNCWILQILYPWTQLFYSLTLSIVVKSGYHEPGYKLSIGVCWAMEQSISRLASTSIFSIHFRSSMQTLVYYLPKLGFEEYSLLRTTFFDSPKLWLPTVIYFFLFLDFHLAQGVGRGEKTGLINLNKTFLMKYEIRSFIRAPQRFCLC